MEYCPESSVYIETANSCCNRRNLCSWCKDNLLLILTFIATLLGIGGGVGLRYLEISSSFIMWMGLPAELFLRSLSMIIIPLVVCNLISVTSTTSLKTEGRMFGALTVYLLTMNLLGSLTGIFATLMFKPGIGVEQSIAASTDKLKEANRLEIQDIVADLLRNMIPDNIIGATLYSSATQYVGVNLTDNNSITTQVFKRQVSQSQGSNIIGLIMFSILFGLMCKKTQADIQPLLAVLHGIAEVCMTMLHLLIWALPPGMFSLTLTAILGAPNLTSVMNSIGLLIAVSVCSNIFQILVINGTVFFMFVRTDPIPILKSFGKALFIGFGTGSQLVALPAYCEGCDRAGLSQKVSRSTLPIAVMIGKSGSACFLAIGAMFIVQAEDVEIDLVKVLVIVALVNINAAAQPPTPSSSFVIIVLMCAALKLSTRSIGLLFAADFLLDRIRSFVNGLNIVNCCCVVDKFCSNDHVDNGMENIPTADSPNGSPKTGVSKKKYYAVDSGELDCLEDLKQEVNIS